MSWLDRSSDRHDSRAFGLRRVGLGRRADVHNEGAEPGAELGAEPGA